MGGMSVDAAWTYLIASTIIAYIAWGANEPPYHSSEKLNFAGRVFRAYALFNSVAISLCAYFTLILN